MSLCYFSNFGLYDLYDLMFLLQFDFGVLVEIFQLIVDLQFMILIYYFLFGTPFNIGDMSLIITGNFYSTDLIVLIVVLFVVPGDVLFRSLIEFRNLKIK